jgi:hypothetical protein
VVKKQRFLIFTGLALLSLALVLSPNVPAADKDTDVDGIQKNKEAGPVQPKSAGPKKGKGATKTAMVIVVENNQAQTYSMKKTDFFGGMEKSLKVDFGDLELDLPKWAKDIIKKTADLIEKVVGKTRDLYKDMLKEIVGEVDNALGSQTASCAKDMLQAIGNAPAWGPQPGNVFLDRFGEKYYADCLRDMAEPKYDKVVVLTDQTAIFDNFKSKLEELNSEGYLIDILLDIHGCGDFSNLNNDDCDKDALLFADGKKTHDDIKGINGGKPMNLNAVYMVSCWGNEFNKDWLRLGAKASNGAKELNYYVLVSPLVFMDGWTRGMSLEEASEKAYKHEKNLLNGKKKKFKIKIKNPVTQQNESVTIAVLGATWEKKMNKALAKDHAEDKSKPIDNKKSSKRINAGDGSVRRAGL